jgi:hypothetical protein
VLGFVRVAPVALEASSAVTSEHACTAVISVGEEFGLGDGVEVEPDPPQPATERAASTPRAATHAVLQVGVGTDRAWLAFESVTARSVVSPRERWVSSKASRGGARRGLQRRCDGRYVEVDADEAGTGSSATMAAELFHPV